MAIAGITRTFAKDKHSRFWHSITIVFGILSLTVPGCTDVDCLRQPVPTCGWLGFVSSRLFNGMEGAFEVIVDDIPMNESLTVTNQANLTFADSAPQGATKVTGTMSLDWIRTEPDFGERYLVRYSARQFSNFNGRSGPISLTLEIPPRSVFAEGLWLVPAVHFDQISQLTTNGRLPVLPGLGVPGVPKEIHWAALSKDNPQLVVQVQDGTGSQFVGSYALQNTGESWVLDPNKTELSSSLGQAPLAATLVNGGVLTGGTGNSESRLHRSLLPKLNDDSWAVTPGPGTYGLLGNPDGLLALLFRSAPGCLQGTESCLYSVVVGGTEPARLQAIPGLDRRFPKFVASAITKRMGTEDSLAVLLYGGPGEALSVDAIVGNYERLTKDVELSSSLSEQFAPLQSATQSVKAVTFADIDQDGEQDLLVLTSERRTGSPIVPHLWCVFFPGPAGPFHRTELPLPAPHPELPAGDDFVDLSAASYRSDLSLLMATGTRTGNSAQIHGLYLYTQKGM